MKRIIHPVFQAVVRVGTRSICWVEALARVTDDDTQKGHGPLIKIAEKFGFVHHLDSAILDGVMDVQRSLGLPVAVNVSVVTIERYPEVILDLLASRPEIAKHVILEVTETAQITDLAVVQSFVRAVRRFGCRIAVDDYGTGFFTTQLVRDLRPDVIKLSRNLMDEVFDKSSPELLAEITEVGREVGADLLAEGIDSWSKFDQLGTYGCRYAQGFAIGRPGSMITLLEAFTTLKREVPA